MRKKYWLTVLWWGYRLILVGIIMMILGGVLFLLGHWLNVVFWYGGGCVIVIGACMIRIYYSGPRRPGWD
ncbi:MAG: hypothetical protein ACFFCO_02740 [Promethearchaeota archaeon]